MKRSGRMAAFLPWAGLTAALVGGGLAHQFGAEGTFDNCQAISPGPLLVVAAVGVIIALVGGFGSWRVWSEKSEGPARRLVAAVSLGTVAILLFAVILPMIASLLIPPCFQ